LDFELLTISNSGYPGYFLIVQDLIASREYGRFGSPGRGSAAGSVVAYCLKITEYRSIDVQPAFELPESDRHYPILISILMMKAEAV
jgi:DNA polymerase-3 subunit alpha